MMLRGVLPCARAASDGYEWASVNHGRPFIRAPARANKRIMCQYGLLLFRLLFEAAWQSSHFLCLMVLVR